MPLVLTFHILGTMPLNNHTKEGQYFLWPVENYCENYFYLGLIPGGRKKDASMDTSLTMLIRPITILCLQLQSGQSRLYH